MYHFFEFIIIFVLIYAFYHFTVIKKTLKYDKKKSLMEIDFLVAYQKLDIKKLNFTNLLKLVYLTNSLIIAFSIAVSGLFENFIFQILIAVTMLIPLILLGYYIIGRYYREKTPEKRK